MAPSTTTPASDPFKRLKQKLLLRLMRFKLTFFLVLISFLLLTAADAAAQMSGNSPAIDAFIQERMESLNIPGAAVAIVRDGEIVHLAGYGAANEKGDPVTPQTPFLLASLSKSVTAVAAGYPAVDAGLGPHPFAVGHLALAGKGALTDESTRGQGSHKLGV